MQYEIKKANAAQIPVIGLSVLALNVVAASIAQAAPAKPAAKPATKSPGKPAAKPAAKPSAAPAKPSSGPVVLGTQQMPGDFGKFGTTYTIGKEGPINFTLKSAEYTITPFQIDQNTIVPTNAQKILVLHYTIHNPLQREQRYSWEGIRFTAVDSHSTNHEFIEAVHREGATEGLDLHLKPAQKVEVVTAIVVPAQGQIPKLIVQREVDAPVIRYDLRGKVQGLESPFADPSDTTGATARAEIPASAGVFYPFGPFQMRLENTAYTTNAILDETLEEGKRYFTAIFTVKNVTGAEQGYAGGNFNFGVKDADGEKVEYNGNLLKATRNEYSEGTLKPGEENRVRFYAVVPEDVAVETLSLRETRSVDAAEARIFTFAVPKAQ